MILIFTDHSICDETNQDNTSIVCVCVCVCVIDIIFKNKKMLNLIRKLKNKLNCLTMQDTDIEALDRAFLINF